MFMLLLFSTDSWLCAVYLYFSVETPKMHSHWGKHTNPDGMCNPAHLKNRSKSACVCFFLFLCVSVSLVLSGLHVFTHANLRNWHVIFRNAYKQAKKNCNLIFYIVHQTLEHIQTILTRLNSRYFKRPYHINLSSQRNVHITHKTLWGKYQFSSELVLQM